MTQDNEGRAISRRDALKRGAVVGGALLWTVPAVQAISLTSASAATPSASVEGNKHRKPTKVLGEKKTRLPFTGASNTGSELVTGAGLVAVGAAAVVAAKRKKAAGEADQAVEA